MIITGMKHFQNVCKKKLVEWYNTNADIYHTQQRINLDDVFVVWSCKTLQNYKCLVSTTVPGDGIYAEYTYNGDKQELYEDVYKKFTNTCIQDEWYKWQVLKILENSFVERRYNKENVLTLDSLVTVFLSEVLYEIRDELDEIEDVVLSGKSSPEEIADMIEDLRRQMY